MRIGFNSMIANPPEQWMTPADRAEEERIANMPIEQLKAELIAQGVDVDGFLKRINATVERLKRGPQ